MKKITVDLPKGPWGTIKTKYAKNSAIISPVEFTGASKNFDTWRKGSITKRLGGDYFNTTPFSTAVQDTYEAIFADGSRNLIVVDDSIIKYSTGTTTFNTLLSGVTPGQNWEFTMYQDRVYGGNATNDPIVYDKSKVTKIKNMGTQAPVIGSCAATAGSAVANTVPDGTYTYKITYLYYGSEESNGSGATASVTVTGGPRQINLTGIPVSANDHVTARKIYRDDGITGYLLIDTINNNTATTYTDIVPAGTSDIPTENYAPTNFGLCLTYLDRIWTARIVGQPSYVNYSEAGLPDIFLSTNYLLCNPVDPIVAIVEWNDRIIVLNRTSIGQILGRTKDSFRYSSISDSVGCADNRSVRVRTVDGIPTLVWLSSRGLYAYNGSAVTYISDPIEDLLNVNVQQASNTKGKNSQVPTYSLTNPSKVWNDNAEWDDGNTQLGNIASLLDNSLRVPTAYAPANTDGTYLGQAAASGAGSTLPVASDFTFDIVQGAVAGWASEAWDSQHQAVAYELKPARTGIVGTIDFPHVECFDADQNPNHVVTPTVSNTYHIEIQSDYNGSPSGTKVYDSGPITVTAVPDPNPPAAPAPYGDYYYTPPPTYVSRTYYFDASVNANFTITGNTRYWMIIRSAYPIGRITKGALVQHSIFSVLRQNFGTGYWESVPNAPYAGWNWKLNYNFIQAPVAASGQWVSNVYDSKSDTVSTAVYIDQTATIPSSGSTDTTIEVSDNFSGPFVSDSSSTINNLNGTNAFTLTVAKRFWRLRQTLSVSDDRQSIVVGMPNLRFTTQGVWVSDVIDCSADITAFNALTSSSTGVSGTSLLTFIRTSPDGVGSWTAWNSDPLAVSVQQYAQVKAELNTTSDNVSTPVLQSLQLDWTKTLTVTGVGIDTGATPVGWDTFVASFALNDGTVTFYTRAASTLVGLSSATWHAITSGSFIAESLLQFVQWKAVMVATAGNVPTLAGVDVNWYTSLSTAIRAASLFVNRSYYLSVAEYNNSTNNLVIVLDPEGKFRVYRDLSISSFVLAFSEAYAVDASAKKLLRWLSNNTDQGTPIEMVVQTKALDFDASRNDKIMKKFYLKVLNTGARFYSYCSYDMGATWVGMKDMHTGLSYVDTPSDGALNITRWVPDFNAGINQYGKTISFKVTTNDSNAAEIIGLESECWIRSGDII